MAAYVQSRQLAWAVQAPALLFVAVVSTVSSGRQEQQIHQQQQQQQQQKHRQPATVTTTASAVALQALHTALGRPPSPDLLLPSPDPSTDLCTAVELVLERLLADGDVRGFAALLTGLLATLAGALTALLINSIALQAGIPAVSFSATPAAPPSLPRALMSGLIEQQPPSGGLYLAAAAAAAAAGPPAAAAAAEGPAVEAALDALTALHGCCRQLGAACIRSAAAAAAASVAVSGAGSTYARPAAAGAADPGAAALADAAAHLLAAVSAAAATAPDIIPGRQRGAATVGMEPPSVVPLGAVAGHGAWRLDLRPASVQSPAADPRVLAAVVAAAAGGLLEGSLGGVRLQQPQLQPQLMNCVHRGLEHLSGALQHAAAAAAVAATAEGPWTAVPQLNGLTAAVTGPTAPAQPTCGSISGSGRPEVVVRAASDVLAMAVGYSWVRLRLLPLPQGASPAVAADVAERMVAAAAAASTGPTGPPGAAGAGGLVAGAGWHPSRGSLLVLLRAALGVARVLDMAASGCSPTAAAEFLETHSRGPLFADVQSLARVAVEAARSSPSPPGGGAASGTLAADLLYDTASAARRLHVMYGSVVDTGAGQAWLAALPPPPAAVLRQLLDRVFVCVVSVLATAYGTAVQAVGAAGGPPQDQHRKRIPLAVAALGALADVQFCALQLRAHGDLVARLSADLTGTPPAAAAAAAPLAALLPCYPAFACTYGGGASAVAVSRLGFLLPLAALCVPYTPDSGAAAAVVLPYVYVLLKGAPERVAQAAHAVWAALLANLCQGPRRDSLACAAEGTAAGGSTGGAALGGRGSGSSGAGKGSDGSAADGTCGAGVELAASMVPYYMERKCQAPCSVLDVEQLEGGLMQALRFLPLAHPMKAWCVARLVQQLVSWSPAAAAAAATATAPPGRSLGPETTGQQSMSGYPGSRSCGPQQQQQQQQLGLQGAASGAGPGAHMSGDDTGRGLNTAQFDIDTEGVTLPVFERGAAAVAVLVGLLDFPLLPYALQALSDTLPRLSPGGAPVVLQQLHDVWLQSNDYGRKGVLDGWLQAAVAGLRAGAPGGPGFGTRVALL